MEPDRHDGGRAETGLRTLRGIVSSSESEREIVEAVASFLTGHGFASCDEIETIWSWLEERNESGTGGAALHVVDDFVGVSDRNVEQCPGCGLWGYGARNTERRMHAECGAEWTTGRRRPLLARLLRRPERKPR